MNILITGGAGFIGSNFILYFIEKYPEYNIINVDKLSYAANLSFLDSIKDNPRYTFVKADISDRSAMEELFQEHKIDAIINFAAESHVDRSIVDSTPFVLSNVLGTQVLLDLAVKYSVKKFHQISTDEVYGDLPLDTDYAFNEKDMINPRNPYSATKAGGEMLVLSYYTTHKLPILITRASNNFGPHQNKEKFLPTCINSLLQNKKIPIYGDGKYIRDWLFTEDHCKAIDLVFHNGEIGEIYNISAHNERPNIDMAKLIIKLMGVSEDSFEFVEDRPGHDRRYSIDSNKIRNELSWKPEVDFEEEISRTIDWYKETL